MYPYKLIYSACLVVICSGGECSAVYNPEHQVIICKEEEEGVPALRDSIGPHS